MFDLKARITIILIFLSFSLLGQNSDTSVVHSIKLQTGVHSYYTRDLTISPLIYHSIAMPFSLGYTRSNNSNIHDIELLFCKTLLKSSSTEENKYYSNNSSLYNAENTFNFVLIYKYLYKKQPLLNGDLFLGGVWKNFVLFKQHYYYYSNHWVSFDCYSSINFEVRWNKNLSLNKELSVSLNYPLVAYVIGRNYTTNFPTLKMEHENYDISFKSVISSGDFLFLNKFVDFHFGINYSIILTKFLSCNFSYNFNFYRYYKLQLAENGMHIILAGLIINF